MASAVVLDAAPVLMAAAPVLLGVGPALHPVGEAGVAVVDTPVSMPHAVLDVHVEVIAAVPRPRAAATCVATAPGLLVVRPAKIPVRKPGTAVVLEVVNHMRRCWRRQMHVASLVNDVLRGRDRHAHVVVMCRHGHRIPNLLVDHVALGFVVGACTAKSIAAVGLLVCIPKVLPVMVSLVAVDGICGWLIVARRRPGPEIPRQEA